MGKLILIRHGHTALNGPGEDERLRGWLDVPLDQQGLDEARGIAIGISRHPVEAIYCSDQRCDDSVHWCGSVLTYALTLALMFTLTSGPARFV